MQPVSYRHHQFPPGVIRHTVWLYLRFTLSYRDVEEPLAERGLEISYEAIRRWVLKFGPAFARKLRRPATSAERSVASGWCVTNTFLKEEMWSCTRDEGWPLEVRSQVPASNPCKLRPSRATVVSVAAKGGT